MFFSIYVGLKELHSRERIIHRMHFNHRLGFFYDHKSVIDTIFNISWQISIMKSKKVVKCHFVSALSCKCKCWLLKQLLATFYLKSLTNRVNAICFWWALFISVSSLSVIWSWREAGSWEVFLSLIQIACRDRIRGSLFRPSLTKTDINQYNIYRKQKVTISERRENDLICLPNQFYFQDMK